MNSHRGAFAGGFALIAAWTIIFLTVARPDVAAAASPDTADPGQACVSAARTASKKAGLPAGLLHAIGLVETGRLDPAGLTRTPWPYAVDVDGGGRWFDNAASAIRYVRTALNDGARFVDVGCFQIDLEYHPDAFASLTEAFDPARNATYAAGFLVRLHGQYGSWPAAIAAYHSADPAQGKPYARRVMAAWTHAPREAPAGPEADPYVIHIGPAQSGLPRIVTP